MELVLPLLALLLACGPDAAPTAAPPTVDETVTAVRLGLSDAHRRWSAGETVEAKAAVLATYQSHFELLEPDLRAHDPRETLELEYAFAVLANHLARKGSPVEVAAEVRELTSRVEKAAAALPRQPGEAPKPEQPQVPATTSVPMVEERGADAPGISSAKPEPASKAGSGN